MISYDASSLDSNRTLLQEFHRIEDYLKKNPVYKCYALQDDYVVGTSQYSIADLVASESQLAEGDVVIFANAYVGFVSSVGEEYFSVINVVNIKGPQGPQGVQGPQGPAGADGQDGTDGTNGVDGKPVLWYNLEVAVASQEAFITMLSESSHTFTKNYFSRVGEYGDEFMAFVNVHNGNVYEQYIMLYKILTWAEGVGTCTAQYQQVYAKITGPKGDDGSAGPSALCYDRNIPFTHQGGGGSLEAFTVGETLSNGDKIHFDITKGSELATYLEGLTYLDGASTFLITNGEISLSANDMSVIAGINDCYVLAFGNSQTFEMSIVYATKSGEFSGISWNEGFNNLDTNGDFILSLTSNAEISRIDDTNPASWNGVIIGVEGESQPVSEQLISVTLPFANFNRTPELNQDFVGILEDNGVCYVAQCEVQSISGTNVTSIVASDINRITGEKGADGQNGTDGTDGTNGTDGVDALVYNTIYTSMVTPYVGQVFYLDPSSFNRTAKVNEYFNLLMKTSTSPVTTYIAVCQVTAVGGSLTIEVKSYSSITGPQGASPAKLYLHYITTTFSSSGYPQGKLVYSAINSVATWNTTSNNTGKLQNYLTVCGLVNPDKFLPLSGYIETGSGTGTFYPAIGCYAVQSEAPYIRIVYSKGDGTEGYIATNGGSTLSLVTVELQ